MSDAEGRESHVAARNRFLRAANAGPRWTVKKGFFDEHELVACELVLLE